MSETTSSVQVKSHESPDEHRTPQKTNVDVNHFDEYTIGRIKLEPGWSWSECIKPVVQTESCQLLHVGYCVSGSIEVVMDDGTRVTITAGDSYKIPPGHDAHVLGDEPVEALEFASAAAYGVPAT